MDVQKGNEMAQYSLRDLAFSMVVLSCSFKRCGHLMVSTISCSFLGVECRKK